MESSTPAPVNDQENQTQDPFGFETQVRESKELAGALLNGFKEAEDVASILGANGLTIEQQAGTPGNPSIRLNKLDFSEPIPEENQAVETLADFLGRAKNVMTRFPDQTYSSRDSGHRLELLWNNGLNTSPSDLLEQVRQLLNTAIEHNFGV